MCGGLHPLQEKGENVPDVGGLRGQPRERPPDADVRPQVADEPPVGSADAGTRQGRLETGRTAPSDDPLAHREPTVMCTVVFSGIVS